MKSAAARGRDFEVEIAEFLRAAGFGVISNARVAAPRQTDLFARSGDVDLLVEVKHRDRKIDVSDIDALRSRLNRVAPEVVGAIFTRSALTKNAIRAIELDRTREILVFVRQEIEQLYSQPGFLRSLLDRKRSELRVQGRVWFGGSLHNEFANVPLPSGSVEFRMGEEAQAYFESKSHFAGAFFAFQIPAPGWGTLGGEGARLALRLELHRVEDLRNILGYIHQKFGLSNDGMFLIQQSQCCWHGVGAENFLRSLEQPMPRYSSSHSKEFHHSEECIYFDRFRDGWLEISCSARNRLWGASRLVLTSF